MAQKPRAEPGTTCPLWRKDVSKVCDSCAWWTQIIGTHPQTGETINRWQCAIAATFLATLETAKASNEAGAVTQELRNDMHRERQGQARVLASAVRPHLLAHDMHHVIEQSQG